MQRAMAIVMALALVVGALLSVAGPCWAMGTMPCCSVQHVEAAGPASSLASNRTTAVVACAGCADAVCTDETASSVALAGVASLSAMAELSPLIARLPSQTARAISLRSVSSDPLTAPQRTVPLFVSLHSFLI